MIDGFNGAYRFLSNFYPCTIEFEGLVYPSVENAYQAAKTMDNDKRWAIAQMRPGDSKRAGRSLSLREDWEDVKLPIMKRLLQKKFYDPGLQQLLLLTGEHDLCEGNYWHDNYWGICTCLRCARAAETPGNHLGLLLMEVRSEISANAHSLI